MLHQIGKKYCSLFTGKNKFSTNSCMIYLSISKWVEHEKVQTQINFFWFPINYWGKQLQESSYRMINSQLRLHLSPLQSLEKNKKPKNHKPKLPNSPRTGNPYNPVAQPACRHIAPNLHFTLLLHSFILHWYLPFLLFTPNQAQLCWNEDTEFKVPISKKSQITKFSGTDSRERQ